MTIKINDEIKIARQNSKVDKCHNILFTVYTNLVKTSQNRFLRKARVKTCRFLSFLLFLKSLCTHICLKLYVMIMYTDLTFFLLAHPRQICGRPYPYRLTMPWTFRVVLKGKRAFLSNSSLWHSSELDPKSWGPEL